MRPFCAPVLSLSIALLCSTAAYAVDYYVSSGVPYDNARQLMVMSGPIGPVGNDSNPGTAAQPFRTIQKALPLLKPGSTLYVRGGEYDTVNGLAANDGTSYIPSGSSWSQPVTIKAYPGEKPVFRRYVPKDWKYTEEQIQTTDPARMPTYEEAAAEAKRVGVPLNFPWGCFSSSGSGLGPGELPPVVYSVVGGYVLYLGNPSWNPVQYLVFDGIDFDARGLVIGLIAVYDGARHIRFQNCDIRNSVQSAVANPGGDESLELDHQWINVKVHHAGVPFDPNFVNGIPAREHPAARFHQSWYMHSGGVLWDGCEVYKCAGAGISPLGTNNTIRNSYFHDNNAMAIICYGGWVLENNIIVGGGIQTYGGIFRNNTVIAEPEPNSISYGAYIREWATGDVFENNIFYGWNYGITSGQLGGVPAVARNNLILSLNPDREIYEWDNTAIRVVRQNNVFKLDPQFVNAAARDFRLLAGSPAIDKGKANSLISDFARNLRPQGAGFDIGAYEYGGSTPQPVLPTISVLATDASAAESGNDAGVFTLTRTGSTASALTVSYAVSGSATNGTDYQALSGSATIAAGQTSVTVSVVPIDDSAVEGTETVALTLNANAAYVVGSPASAQLSIADNDVVTGTLSAVLLGRTGEDIVGQTTEKPNGTPDVHIRLTGVSGTIAGARITSRNTYGVWQTPFNGSNWIVGIRPQTGNPSVVDLYCDFWQDLSVYTVALTFADGSTKTVDTTAASAVTATLLGRTGEDVVGQTTETANGNLDVHVRIDGAQRAIKKVRVTAGIGIWATPFNGSNWIVAIRPRTDASVVDLFFEFYQNYSSYTVALTFDDGSTQTVVTKTAPISGLQQGGFEAPMVGVDGVWGSFRYAPSGSAWIFSAGAGISANGSGFTSGNANAPEGAQIAFVQGISSLTQNVDLAAGTYSLTFRAAQRLNWQATWQTIRVTIDGQSLGEFRPSGGSYQSVTTASFTAAAGPHVISFSGLNPNGGDNTAFIDNVVLSASVAAPTGNG